MSRILADVSSWWRLPARRETGSFRAVATIRSKNHFRVTQIRVWPFVVGIFVVLLLGGGLFLALFQPSPPRQHFEVTVPNERLAH
jgi:hypothetical protein